jgi:dTDP-4-amino-4,6-dideoxygalactose transaminase
MSEEEWMAVKEPILSGWLTQGPQVAEFEKAFAERHRTEHALAVSSCTTGLHLILAAMGIGPGDEVIVPAFTWVATANVVLYCGAKPVFVDIELDSFNIDPAKVAEKITHRTKAILAVHLFGHPADMEGLKKVAGSIPIVEDAACAAGAAYHGMPVGGLGLAAAFSFHPRKSVTTGEGGMVTTNDARLAETMNMLRNHGASLSEEQRHHGPQPYLLPEFNLMGFNYRMTDLQGAIGKVQFRKLDDFINEREAWARYYIDELAAIPWLRLPKLHDKAVIKHGWQSFVTLVDPKKAPKPRNEIMKFLHNNGIATRPGTHAVTTLGFYVNKLNVNPNDFPQARFAQEQTLAIPLHNKMVKEDYTYVAEVLKSV